MAVEGGLKAVAQESGAVTEERLTDEGLGQDIGDVAGGGDGAEEDIRQRTPHTIMA